MTNPKSEPSPLAQALVIRALRGDPPIQGAELAKLRNDVLEGEHWQNVAASRYASERIRLMKIGISNMPPDSDDVALLLETLSQRLGAVGHAKAWESIGVGKDRGRGLLARNHKAVDWPLWKTLRDAALDL